MLLPNSFGSVEMPIKLKKNIIQQTKLVPFLLIHIYIHMYITLALIRNPCCIRLYKVQFGIEDMSVLNLFLPYQVEIEL